ncbi:MAG: tryptophan--tRNA ligase [Clostridiales bacterium]|nr:tryptophan--tRNA ligase [Clostridiales bacterium]
MKKILYSATKPTGDLTIGNYLGAIKNWIKLQDEYDCYFCIANLHAHTVDLSADFVKTKTMKQFAMFLACGLDPEKSIIYVQSQVKEHSELCWLLNCNTMMGEANRMTQYKDHVAKGEKGLTTALFTYPVLMAADILLFNTNIVPVGEDQVQHVELTRDIANRFNNRFGATFVVPKAVVPKVGARIKGLLNPQAKMGKSGDDVNNMILLEDSDEVIVKKVKRAVTDSLNQIKFDEENQPGVSNLLTIISACEGKEIEDVVKELEGLGYGALKNRTAEAIISVLKPIREKYEYYLSHEDELMEIMKKGAKKAEVVAKETLERAKQNMGLL